jgi:hypothetical protein
MGMFDGIGGAIGGVLGFIGQQQTNQKSWDIAQSQNQASAEQAQKQMDFQKEMRETQYQTTVEDLKKAGLNPMLAYTQGGAGVPAGAMGQVSAPSFKSPVSSAKEAAAAIASTLADIALKDEQAIATTAQSEVSRTQALQNIATTAKANQDEKTGAAVEEVNKKQLDAIAAEIEYKKAATKTTSAQTAKTYAEEKNIKANEAPSGDPYWYRDLKKFGHSAKQAWEEKIKPVNKYTKEK